ncbi:MAG: acylphosphatase [Acidiferrobacterales bacterium]|jgi:acylphosphatase|nr:acylphosphatase [Acidiferrobacterales bacterium]
MACRYFLVTGRVQGVFYRASTQEVANRMSLVGWVRNREDRSVELVACGEEVVLRQLEQWLWQGPKFAEVSGVQVSILDPEEVKGFTDFSIRY